MDLKRLSASDFAEIAEFCKSFDHPVPPISQSSPVFGVKDQGKLVALFQLVGLPTLYPAIHTSVTPRQFTEIVKIGKTLLQTTGGGFVAVPKDAKANELAEKLGMEATNKEVYSIH